MNALNGDKALIPDNFSLAFYWTFWEVLKEDTTGPQLFFRSFMLGVPFEMSLNATFIALISKKVGAKENKDFRLIRHIISIVPTNRPKTMLEKIISRSQNSFIKGRQF